MVKDIEGPEASSKAGDDKVCSLMKELLPSISEPTMGLSPTLQGFCQAQGALFVINPKSLSEPYPFGFLRRLHNIGLIEFNHL